MRGGTIIKIIHGTSAVVDINKDDGYIEIGAKNTTYFSGGSSTTLDVAAGGDILQIRNASGTHIHALGHDASPGASWGPLPTPKVLFQDNTTTGESIKVWGDQFTDYNGGASTTSTIVKEGFDVTSGLSNDNPGNQLLWRTWREPIMTTQTVTANVCGANCVDFTFNKATDPVPTDQTQGYIILRKPVAGTFTAPTDGTTYTVGAALGGATVVANLDNPTAGTTVFFTDPTAPSGTFQYRVYAYRYGTDNPNGNSFALERGRVYNTTNFVTATMAFNFPLPVVLLNFIGKELNNTSNLLEWATSSEINNDFFTLERSENAIDFEPIATLKGVGNSSQFLHYNYVDVLPSNKNIETYYYRLKQTDFDGKFEYFDVIAITRKINNELNVFSYENELIIQNNHSIPFSILIVDVTGRVVYTSNETINKLNLNFLKQGVYIYQLRYNNSILSNKIVIR